MEEAFKKDVYSSHFNGLKRIGLWNHECKSGWKNRLFYCFRCLMLTYSLGSMTFALVDLYLYRDDIKSVNYNLSTTVLALGLILKFILISYKSDVIDKLRRTFFSDAWNQTKEAEKDIHRSFKRIYFIIWKIFMYSIVTFIPLWVCASLYTLLRGPRHLPFSFWLPLNLDDDKDFAIGFAFHALICIYVGHVAVHGEMSFYTLVLQMAAQYKVLANDIEEIGKVYIELSEEPEDARESRVHSNLKKCIRRHLKLAGYAQKLWDSIQKGLTVGMLISAVLITVNCLEVLQDLSKGEVRWWYHACYASVITADVFMVTVMGTILRNEKERLSESVYQLPWYEMRLSTQKNIVITLIGMRKSSTFTLLKVVNVEVSSFSWAMKSVISVMTLFWQFIKRQ